ncbi:nucleotide 5'-monophosphate nucleosidase PpnN [Pelagibaculum spongiae]|uniref:AMP nucleosidase n=1 Tax=Pelagibaculum spongiae TaxID=2080658 RepID=A0A2V1H0X6_9GAMM|nr:nucleotide 5'-monophosphate nucleosidase PpnN [Pelagibaculum spongiae]PVZ69672.1 LOG family protein [Pelagibaculum spongiae]
MAKFPTVDAFVSPAGSLEILSQHEIQSLSRFGHSNCYDLLRNCLLAVLNCGSEMDDGHALLQQYPDFTVNLIERDRGIQLHLQHAPASAFVDGVIINGIREHLFSVLRDIVYVNHKLQASGLDLSQRPEAITDSVFRILRNAEAMKSARDPKLIICWGGHAISREEYEYSKSVGYQLGLRAMDICTGCGPGAMKGPMKGAQVAHAKQRIDDGRYVGVSEPGIIAAESPNPIVNELVILPDIEKRLEAFVRMGHGMIVFPGGPGTAEEILYLLGILMDPANHGIPFPFVMTGPASSKDYFAKIDAFLVGLLGEHVRDYYKIMVNQPEEVARHMSQNMEQVREYRKEHKDAYHFNWRLRIDPVQQFPFEPEHTAVAALQLDREMPADQLAANLRRIFSVVVAGNVKAEGIARVKERGPYQIHGAPDVLEPLDQLLRFFVEQRRMKIEGEYVPCYQIVN